MPNDLNLRRFLKTICSFFHKEGIEAPSVFSNLKTDVANDTLIPIKACFNVVYQNINSLRNKPLAWCMIKNINELLAALSIE